MISENDLNSFENLGLEERIRRIEELIAGKEKPRAFELGMLLALTMANEIRLGKALGEDSAELVSSWMEIHPESVVEEAIASAKEFLMNSEALTEKLKSSLISTPKEPQ
ncbi:MAG: hypothetical protein LBR60_05660 [Fibrobacter sp.]|jgi:hypothetical protein|nr:hypothetical protein [Fibrobacter sp.]